MNGERRRSFTPFITQIRVISIILLDGLKALRPRKHEVYTKFLARKEDYTFSYISYIRGLKMKVLRVSAETHQRLKIRASILGSSIIDTLEEILTKELNIKA